MPESDAALLEAAAREAGHIAMSYFRRDPRVWEKADAAGPVTEADLAVNEMLSSKLRAARTTYGWLSEESVDGEGRLATERQFIVDPIDGTRAFIAGSADWAHALAVVDRERPVAAAVYLPASDMMFTAEVGQGAFLNGEPIRATDVADPLEARILASKFNFAPNLWREGAAPIHRHFRSSLALRMCLVAQGAFDAMLTLRPAWEWDIAAGALIVAEAGGKVTGAQGSPLRFNNPHPQVASVVAGGAVHPALISALAPPSVG